MRVGVVTRANSGRHLMKQQRSGNQSLQEEASDKSVNGAACRKTSQHTERGWTRSCLLLTWQSHTARHTTSKGRHSGHSPPQADLFAKIIDHVLAWRDAFSERVPSGEDTSTLSIIVMLLEAISR